MSDNPDTAALKSSSTGDLKGRLLTFVSEEDIPALVSMGRSIAYYNQSYQTEYSPERAEATLRGIMKSGAAIVYKIDDEIVGFIMGMVVPVWYGNTSMAIAIALWVVPEHRGEGITANLVNFFEQWGVEAGASHITIYDVCINNKYPSERVFQTLGYHPVERAHLKEVG
jgi:GNAT superfamily N-acetyltransferase